MKISPYVSFGGNCAEAVAFYKKAFNVKAEIIGIRTRRQTTRIRWRKTPKNLVMHAQFEIDGEPIMLCDIPVVVSA